MPTGCPRCVPGAEEGPGPDEEVDTDAEGNSRLALPPQVPEDAVQLRCSADVHAWIPKSTEIPASEFDALLQRANIPQV